MDALVRTGEVVAGKYRIDRVIGSGGMGVVVQATHLQLDERVALKFLRPEAMLRPDIALRFDREARAAAKLKSEHVARVFDVGRRDDGVPYIVMEYLEGHDLADVLRLQSMLPVEEAVEYTIQACEGLAEAHARGIVHRDIKPENLFLVERALNWRMVKILDFGISKAALGADALNVTTSIVGTPYYMSPEQLRSSRTVDHRTDIWSLGVVLFELLTGTTAFTSAEFADLVVEILERSPKALCDFREDIPAELEAVLLRCLEKDRSARFQSVAELALALMPFGPRRSRVLVERATELSRAAGLLSDGGLQVPVTIPPRAARPLLLVSRSQVRTETDPKVRTELASSKTDPRVTTPPLLGELSMQSSTLGNGAHGVTDAQGRPRFLLVPAALVVISVALIALVVLQFLGRRTATLTPPAVSTSITASGATSDPVASDT
ncbi:MAG: serine/threonine-protein kinase [Myxococcales bacterium]